jgi:hypothetical protein
MKSAVRVVEISLRTSRFDVIVGLIQRRAGVRHLYGVKLQLYKTAIFWQFFRNDYAIGYILNQSACLYESATSDTINGFYAHAARHLPSGVPSI